MRPLQQDICCCVVPFRVNPHPATATVRGKYPEPTGYLMNNILIIGERKRQEFESPAFAFYSRFKSTHTYAQVLLIILAMIAFADFHMSFSEFIKP
jgi:hypothetical protein